MSAMTETTYQPGSIQNGYVLTEDYQWVPLPPSGQRRSSVQVYEPPVYQGTYWALIASFVALLAAIMPGAGVITSIGVLLLTGFAWKRTKQRRLRGSGILVAAFIIGFAALGISLAMVASNLLG